MPAQHPSLREIANRVLALIRWAIFVLVICLSCLQKSFVSGEEYALIVGGGPNPNRNPVSLETQVLQAIEVLRERKLKRIDVLFSDGDAPEADLVDRSADPPKEKPPEALVAEKYYRLLYNPDYRSSEPTRNHRVPNVQGAATETNVRRWFEKAGMQLQSGDRLLIYFATHGKRIDFIEGEPDESDVLLWNDGQLSATKLRALIQQLPTGVQVTLLMTGCYSSGFAEPGQLNLFGLPDQTRVVGGFFSSLPDRPAAGCTPQAFSAESRDYATCFWAAQRGHWPDGTKLPLDSDLNQDKQVSFCEAHAFALLTDNTLDTPQKRSDIVLRKISRFGKLEETALLLNNASYDDLLAVASPIDAYLLEQLSQQLKLTGRRRMAAARRELRKLGELELPLLFEERLELIKKLTPLRKQLNERLQTKSPIWIYETLSTVANSKGKFPQGFVEDLQSQPEFAEIKKLVTSLQKIDQQRLMLETAWAKYWRFIHVAETVILLHNYPQVADSKQETADFQRLVNEENAY